MVLPEPHWDGPLPFLVVRDYLARCGVRMPDIYHYDPPQGVVLLEDLQDCLLEECVKGQPIEVQRDWYRRAIDLLVEMQVRSCRCWDGQELGYQRAFDTDRFLWEMRRFLTYVIGHYQQKSVPPGDRDVLEEGCEAVARTLCAQPKILTHRDYHCRNIMVRDRQLCMIDFQDARLGPRQYDLASLLRDSYVVLPDDLMEELLDYYLTHPAFHSFNMPGSDNFRAVFDLAAIERNMHAAACFAWLAADCGVQRYLQYIPDTLDYLRKNLARCPSLAGFRRVLAKYLEEVT